MTKHATVLGVCLQKKELINEFFCKVMFPLDGHTSAQIHQLKGK